MASQTARRACLLYVPVLLLVVQLLSKAKASVQAVEKVPQILQDSAKVPASSSSLLMACCTNGQAVQLQLNTCQPNCTSTCEQAPNGSLTLLTTCPSHAAVVLTAAPSPSLTITAASGNESLALPAPQTLGPRRVSASDVVMIVGGAVLLVMGISFVAVLQ